VPAPQIRSTILALYKLVCMYVCMYRQSEKKLVKQQYLLYISAQYGELWPTSGWDHFISLGHPR